MFGLFNTHFSHPIPTKENMVWRASDATLRDAFAIAALQGELAAQDGRSEGKGTGLVSTDKARQFVAENCYRMADAMLKARQQ